MLLCCGHSLGQGSPSHLVQLRLLAGEGEHKAQGEAFLRLAGVRLDGLGQELGHALCNEVKELQSHDWG